MLSLALIELAGISSVAPFLAVAARPELVETNRYLRWAYDYFGFESVRSLLVVLGVAVVLFLFARNASTALNRYVMVRYTNMRAYSLSRRLLHSYFTRPYAFFLNANSSTLANNILGEATTAVTGFLLPWLEVATRTIVAVCIVGLLVAVNPLIAVVVALVLGLLYGGVFILVRKRLTRLGRRRLEANRRRFKATLEALGGIKEVKLMGKESVFLDEFSGPAKKAAIYSTKATVVSEVPRYILETVTVSILMGVLIYVIAFTDSMSQVVSTAGLYVFAAYRLRPALQKLLQNLATMRSSRATVDTIVDHLTGPGAQEAEEFFRERPAPLPFEHRVRLERVTYRYPGSDTPVLYEQTFSIRKNSTVGLVGPTGCGKTTTVDIILGLLRPTEGAMLVDDQEVDSGNLKRWQANLGYVPQHIYLSDSSVARNIAFGVPDEQIDMAAVRGAAKIARLDAFIEGELPDQYQTLIGEQGVRLSGGQRQRLGIARALYSDPAVLVLDEATSALDTVTEAQVMQSIHQLNGGKTIIIIAHRISTVRECDWIYLLDRGRIAAEGNYDTLLDESPQFRDMAASS